MRVSRNRDIYCPSREKSQRNVFLFFLLRRNCDLKILTVRKMRVREKKTPKRNDGMSTEERERKKSWNKGSTRQQIHIRIEKKTGSQRNVFLFSSISVLCVNFSSVLFNETNDTEEKKSREAGRERETK